MEDKFQEPEMSKEDSGRNTQKEETGISDCASLLLQLKLHSKSSVNLSSEQQEKPAGLPQNVSQASGSGAPVPPFGEYIEPPYYEKLLRMLGADDDISVIIDAYKNFDKQRLSSIHNKAGMYLTHPDVAEILRMHYTPEQEIEGTHESVEAADELVQVSLKDLELGKSNEGVVLYGELCVKAFKFGRIYTLLEEAETGNAVALSIVSPDPSSIHQSFAGRNYPEGGKIAVKEPMLVQGEGGLVFIYINNPLSIQTVQSLSAFANATIGEDKCLKWFQCANEAFAAKEWKKCIRNCTKCEISDFKGKWPHRVKFPSFRVHGLRWHAHIQLGRYPEALKDAEACYRLCRNTNFLIGGVKMRIRSLLLLGRYRDTFRLLNDARSVFTFRDEDITSMNDCYHTLGAAFFDIGKAIIGGSAGRPEFMKPDADFIGAVEIRTTNSGNGRGLFTTEDIKLGEVLLISKALAISHKPMEDPLKNGLFQNVKDALSSCGDDTVKLFQSHDACRLLPNMWDFFNLCDEEKNMTTSKEEKSCSVTDAQILDILQRIALDESSPDAVLENGKVAGIFNPDGRRRLYYGVWLLASFINHSCVPNAARINVGDIMRIHATKPIEKGKEITIPYFNVLVPYPSRQKYCEAFGFDCNCKRCEVERKIIQSEPKAKILYDSYSSACRSKIQERHTQLEKIVNQAENCLKVMRQRKEKTQIDKEGEGWIRSSFMAAYFARIVCRKQRSVRTSSSIDEEILWRTAYCIGETCPGDIQSLVFWQNCWSLWTDLSARHLKDVKFFELVKKSYDHVGNAFISVYGVHTIEVRNETLKKLWTQLDDKANH